VLGCDRSARTVPSGQPDLARRRFGLCISIGLAVTLIAAGMIAAIGMRHVTRRWSGFGELADRLPYLSSIVMIGFGLYVGWQGWISVPTAF